MKHFFLISTVTVLSILLVASDAWSRGGARAGGGGGGGGARSAGARSAGGGASRTPSMSRASSKPASASRPATSRPAASAPSTSRPSVSKPSTSRPSTSKPSVSKPSTARPGTGTSRPATGKERPGTGTSRPNLGDNRPGTGTSRPNLGDNRPGTGTSRPNVGGGQAAARPGGGKPSQGDLQDFLHLPGKPNQPSARPGAGTNIGDRTNVGGDRTNIGGGDRTNIGGGDRTKIGGDRTNVGDRTNIRGGDRTNIGNRTNVNIDRGPDITINRQNNINSIRNQWHGVNVNSRPFNRSWWGGHVTGPSWRWQAGWARYPVGWAWRPCTWAAVGGWFTWNWSQPRSYDYGTTIVYQNNAVYSGDQQIATAEVYYQQAETIVQSVPEQVDAEQVEWMPLGVFAIAEQSADDSGMLLQLAVSKEGILAGTFYNNSTEDGRPVEGMVDQESQRAAWRLADGSNPDLVMETGIYNLTQDEASALVHFGAEKTQTWLMVRLPEPEGETP